MLTSGSQASFNDIPEIVLQVMQHINDPHSLARSMRTCRLWYYLVRPLLYMQPNIRSLGQLDRFIRSISLNRMLPGLVKMLNLGQTKGAISAAGIDALCGVGFVHLQRLDLCFCRAVSVAHLQMLAAEPANITQLSLAGARLISDALFTRFARGLGPHLASLSVHDCSFLTDSSLAYLAAHFKSLKSLKLADPAGLLTDGGLGLLGCLGLELLQLYDCPNATDVCLSKIAAQCSASMQVIEFYRLGKVTDFGIVEFARHCRNIHTVGLSEMSKITDASPMVLGLYLDIKHLVIGHSEKLTDRGLTELFLKTPSLLSLDLCVVGEVSAASLIGAAHCCPLLREIVLSGNLNKDNISTKVLLQAARMFTHLETISVYQSIDMLPQDVSELAATCPKLRQIYIHHCANIHPSFAASFSKNVQLVVA